jgi:hypothetical protein
MGSAVLELTSYAPPPQQGIAGKGKHQIKALQILKDLCSGQGDISNVEGRNSARITMDGWKVAMRAGGIPPQRISDVVKSLKTSRKVTEERGFLSPL